MKKKLALILFMVFILSLLPTMAVSAKKPLVGDMNLQYNLGWPYPQDEIPDWVGNITIDGQLYDMAFYCIGSGKSFITSPPDLKGKIHFFEEIWVIGEIDYTFDEFGFLSYYKEVNILCWGYDTGTTNTQTSSYHMNGNVEVAVGPFFGWAGRSVHMKGIIEWYFFGAPFSAPGTFRIN